MLRLRYLLRNDTKNWWFSGGGGGVAVRVITLNTGTGSRRDFCNSSKKLEGRNIARSVQARSDVRLYRLLDGILFQPFSNSRLPV